jgi:hypothetical protein
MPNNMQKSVLLYVLVMLPLVALVVGLTTRGLRKARLAVLFLCLTSSLPLAAVMGAEKQGILARHRGATR